MICIGIDPGVNTGLAVYDRKNKQMVDVLTLKLHDAFELVLQYKTMITIVRIEDARQRTWFGENDTDAKKQGAGSVKRDCTAWEDFLVAKEIPFQMVKPGKIKTKITKQYFQALTGWAQSTSSHSRDAGLLVWGY